MQEHFDEVLSDLEAEVLRLYVEGKSYQEIAEQLGAPREVDRQRAAAHQAQARRCTLPSRAAADHEEDLALIA